MRINNIAWLTFGLVITLFVLTGVSIVLLDASDRQERVAMARRAEFKQLGVDLADASDYLTNEVRNYVQFGERDHYDKYWREVNETRTRDRVLERLKALGALPSEMALIEQAKGHSDALIATEEAAMAAVAEGDFDAARRLMFDQNYEAHKKTIMDSIAEFQRLINKRAVLEAEQAAARASLWLILSNVLISLSAVSITAMIYLVLIRRIVKPITALTTSMRSLADGDTSVDIAATKYRDEVADMIAAVRVFKANAIARARLEVEREERAAELDRKNRQLRMALEQLEEELEIAKQLQLSILPRLYPETEQVESFGKMIAARNVGGDFFDVIEIDENRIGFVIADVSGKGVPTALFMAVSCTLMKSTALRGGRPGQVLEAVNQVLSEGNEASMFVTLFYGILDLHNSRLSYANAGHNPPYMIRNDREVVLLEGTGGVALGAFDGMRYAEKSIELGDGDTIFCYTDGVTEAMDSEGNEFSELRLMEVLYESQGLSVEALSRRVIDHVSEFADSSEQFDDITCVALRYQPRARELRRG